MRRVAAILMVVFATNALAQVATTDEIEQLIKAGDYAQALQRVSAGLALKGDAARRVNRYDLFMAKAECHLMTRATTMALEAYANAIKEAADDRQKSLATAGEMLLKRSRGFVYTPKTGQARGKPPVTIEILGAENRKKAYAALLADELAANEPKLKAARTAKSLPPVVEAVKVLMTLQGVETLAGGETAKTGELLAGLKDQTAKMIAENLRETAKRVAAMDKEANQVIEFYEEVPEARPGGFVRYRKEKRYKKKGLTDAMLAELKEVNQTCERLPVAIDELAPALRTEKKTFEPSLVEAERLAKEVTRILDGEYERVYTEPPGKGAKP
jgi:hypothetical protein